VSDWVVERGLTLLRDAEVTLEAARDCEQTEPAQAEPVARKALAQFRSAMNWLEDTDQFEPAHSRLDEAGAYVRRTFGCTLHQDGERYEQRCPVALAHNRMGLSVGMIVEESECSICWSDPATCLHVKGRTYDDQKCARRITKAKILEVSLVARPAYADARFVAISVDNADLANSLGPAWKPGMTVNCDRCLTQCDGVSDSLAFGLRGH
jgi:hypothetical protein